MEIETAKPRGGVVTLRVVGDVDLGAGRRLSEALYAARERSDRLVVDLTDCTFLDSSGLSALIRAAREHPERHRFAIVAPEEGTVRRVFSLTRAFALVDVHPDAATALAAVTAA